MRKTVRQLFRINLRVILLTILLLVLLDSTLTRLVLPHYLDTDHAAINADTINEMPIVRRLPEGSVENLRKWKDRLAEDNGFRIVFLGDSVVHGSGVPRDCQTIPSYFQLYLRLLLPEQEFDVYSFSLKGCTPADTLHILDFIADVKPDLVIYDVNVGWFGSKIEMDHPQLTALCEARQTNPIRPTLLGVSSPSYTKNSTLNQLITKNWSFYRYRIFLSHLIFRPSKATSAQASISQADLLAGNLLTSHNYDFIPWYEKDFSFLEDREGKLGDTTLDKSNPHWNYYMELIDVLHKNQISSVFFTAPRNKTLYLQYDLLDEGGLKNNQAKLLSAAQQRGIHTFDYTYSVNDRYFADVVHLTEKGNQAVAQMLIWDMIHSNILE